MIDIDNNIYFYKFKNQSGVLSVEIWGKKKNHGEGFFVRRLPVARELYLRLKNV